jgi:hypothetical protein
MLCYDTPCGHKKLMDNYKTAGFSLDFLIRYSQLRINGALRQRAEFWNTCIKHNSVYIKVIFRPLKFYINFSG